MLLNFAALFEVIIMNIYYNITDRTGYNNITDIIRECISHLDIFFLICCVLIMFILYKNSKS